MQIWELFTKVKLHVKKSHDGIHYIDWRGWHKKVVLHQPTCIHVLGSKITYKYRVRKASDRCEISPLLGYRLRELVTLMMELKSLMASGRNDPLWRSVVQLAKTRLALKWLLCCTSTSWGGWDSLDKMPRNLDSILLSDTVPTTAKLVESGGVQHPLPYTNHQWPIKHPQHCPTDVQGSQSL